MKRLNTRFALALALLCLLPALSGCELIDKLQARDEVNKGVRAYTAQNYKEAAEHFSKAVELDPGLIAARLYLAATYRVQFVPGIPSEENLQRAETAIKIFQEVLEQDPANVNAIANIAGLYDGLDMPEKAKEWYRKRIEIEPDNPEPYYGIGTINFKQVSVETGQNGDNVENLAPEKREQLRKWVDSGVDALKTSIDKAKAQKKPYSDAAQYLNLLYRERSYLSELPMDAEERTKRGSGAPDRFIPDEAQRDEWLKEADRFALQALELKRQEEEAAEKARRSFTGKASEGN